LRPKFVIFHQKLNFRRSVQSLTSNLWGIFFVGKAHCIQSVQWWAKHWRFRMPRIRKTGQCLDGQVGKTFLEMGLKFVCSFEENHTILIGSQVRLYSSLTKFERWFFVQILIILTIFPVKNFLQSTMIIFFHAFQQKIFLKFREKSENWPMFRRLLY